MGAAGRLRCRLGAQDLRKALLKNVKVNKIVTKALPCKPPCLYMQQMHKLPIGRGGYVQTGPDTAQGTAPGMEIVKLSSSKAHISVKVTPLHSFFFTLLECHSSNLGLGGNGLWLRATELSNDHRNTLLEKQH